MAGVDGGLELDDLCYGALKAAFLVGALKASGGHTAGFGTCQDVVDTTMRYGNTGDKVLLLQQKLNALGYLDERHLTGTFGSNTRAAVMAYQAGMEGQTVNGLADRTTQQAIDADYQAYLFASPESWLVTE